PSAAATCTLSLHDALPSCGGTVAEIQGVGPAAFRARLELADRMGARRPLPSTVRRRWRGVRPLGEPRRRGAADPEDPASVCASRSRLEAGGGRRRAARAARARGDLGGPAAGGGLDVGGPLLEPGRRRLRR